MPDRIAHDVAWEASLDVFQTLAPLLRQEQMTDSLVRDVYERILAALAAYDLERERTRRRLRPNRE